jgi:hypothetical protein
MTRSRIVRANFMQSKTTDVTRGDGRLMSSRARRTAAMIEAQMASVDVNRSFMRSSAARRSSSYALARFISPMRSSIGEQKTKI